MGRSASSPYLSEKVKNYPSPAGRRTRRRVYVIAAAVVGALLIIAVIVPVYFAVIKPKSNSSKSSTSDSSGSSGSGSGPGSGSGGGSSGGKGSQTLAVTGGDGSTVTTDDGSTFTYSNSFGGYWYWDENDPFNNAAKAQSWTPALNESFNWGTDIIRGVNLGGWLNTEPVSCILSPALYEPYVNLTVPAVDEWTLSWAMGNDSANGGLKQLETHYQTFITEKDFAEIAGAGLNFVRIPLPYWAIETRDGEPFLAKTCWTYFLKAIKWARKYGLRINLDFHALPGSQNGWNHSGRLGDVNVLNGPMGFANAQRSLDYIRILAEFISQPQYSDVVVMFGITNEPQAPIIGQENLSRYYLQAYNNVRGATNNEVGKGPLVSYHDGFLGLTKWAGFLPGADRIALDYHPYLCFGGQPTTPMSAQTTRPCDAWGAQMNTSMDAFGMTGAGEWSNAVTDCGKWVNGVNLGTRYEGSYAGFPAVGSCDPWTDWQTWDDDFKSSMEQYAMASMDALQNWFFWTWKIGNSSVTGKVESPAWSYQLGLENGWMPADPRKAVGFCNGTQPWSGTLSSGSGQIAASATATITWPPTALSHAGDVTTLPSYTPTGTIPTLTAASVSASGTSIDVGDGWANTADSTSIMVPIATCNYLDPWVGENADPPSPLCGGSAAKRAPVPEPFITPAP
ncbi:glycoside hydrolase family 5 protein [Punctularia strigosozonata HHB-11173 SS5]|uniref:glycoside hydrolase family 5 protein n=1 Tax=Punctularia strigosozonata (strain HHB-11173) TaxID=741275 RepID=UPI0004416EE4|nr:glycoside hydrolase family 5 protein [Punctularia strigosozonata HHB-11173 SS5]EIN07519.1 glycoside hydrolase family 5 protein [Punctularia strigosozonata HHB-11173 SS5]